MKYLMMLLLICSCEKRELERIEAFQNSPTLNKGDPFYCALLFEHDGLRIYRFYDRGQWHYFTSEGETMSVYRSGKSNYYNENIKKVGK